jgi:catechol 2,3-dioxygenase-like lactoylglutathione lyase family enzyme
MRDEEFIASFEACSLPGEFHHADHVRMAFLYLCRYEPLDALERFSTSLLRFAASKGKPDRYHETITWAFLLLIRERMAHSQGPQTWAEFAARNPDLLNWKDNILKRYYRGETLSSDLARRTFLLPDKSLPEAKLPLVDIDHVQLAAPRGCEPAARQFFGDLLGLEELEKPERLRSRGGCWFKIGARQLHIGVEEAFRPATKAHPAFAVSDIDALFARLDAAKVACAWDQPVGGVRRFYATDPWGNRLEFTERTLNFG